MHWVEPVILFAALGSGLVGGVFFAFSTFVMRALARVPAAQGIAAMQSINGAAYILAGSLLYLVGTVGVTIGFNVPLNNALAAVKPDSAEGANLWRHYLVRWTAWNHVRTVAALAAAAALTMAQ
jgi:uncharacterized membrane protein